jgi:DNA repair exonuclease SbcCD ATPase subunit
MASFLKSLMGNGQVEEALSQHAEEIIARMERQQAALEEASQRAERSAARLAELAQPVEQIDKKVTEATARIDKVQGDVQGIEGYVSQIAALKQDAEALSKGQRRSETQLANAAEAVERVQADVAELAHKADMALCLKDDLGGFLELKAPFEELQGRAEGLARHLDQAADRVAQIDREQERIATAHDQAESKFRGTEERFQRIHSDVAAAETRVGELTQVMENLKQVADGTADTKRQLVTLQAIADSVSQKIAAIEQHREAVERATRQANNLSELVRGIDVQVRKQEEKAQVVRDLRAEVGKLTSDHAQFLKQAEEIAVRQQRVVEVDKATRARLDGLESELKSSADRMALERDGMDAVSQRVVDLRRDLANFEQRFQSLEDSTRSLPDLQASVTEIAGKLAGTAAEIDRLDEHAQRVGALRADIKRLGDGVATLGKRLDDVEEARTGVESMLSDFNDLRGSHEALRDALDQVQFAAREVRRFRDDQHDTERWLTGVQQLLNEVQAKARELNAARPTIELARKEVDRVTAALDSIENRETFVHEVSKKLAEIGAMSAELDERSKGLMVRMSAADDRLESLVSRADEAAEVEKSVTRAFTELEALQRRSEEFEGLLGGLEGRSHDLESLSQSMEQLGRELERRQSALEKSAEHLERASELRQEAAATARQLEEQSQQFTGALETAEQRAADLTGLAQQLEDRMSGLRFAEKRLGQFEDKLSQWEHTERQVKQALEQLTERQTTIQTIQADIRSLLQMAERTVEDVRSISASQQEIAAARETLDGALQRLRTAEEKAGSLDERQRQIDRAEQRLARVEAVMLQVQSTLETLNGQKAVLDHVVDKTGSLTFQLKQAEALIQTIREERDLTNKIRSAVAEAREDVPEARAG